MGWNIGLAAIERGNTNDVIAALKLGAKGSVEQTAVADTMPLADATTSDVRMSYWGIGTLDNFVLVASQFVTECKDEWKRLSKKHGRVLAFTLSENMDTNELYLYEGGKQVLARRVQKKHWVPNHKIEHGANKHGHPADYIRRVFENFTGKELTSSDVMDVSLTLREPVRTKAADPRTLDDLRVVFEDAIATPWPAADDDWYALRLMRAREHIEQPLGLAWAKDHALVETEWMPRALARFDELPDVDRQVPVAQFERIAKGQDDGRMATLAPLYRTLHLEDRTKFRAKPFTKFFDHPIAAQLTRVECYCTRYPPELAEILSGASKLANVQVLSLDRANIGGAGLAALCRSTVFANLRELNINNNEIDDFAPLHDAPFLPNLERLMIGEWQHGTAIARLLQLCALPSLHTLALGDLELDIAEAITLAKKLPALTRLRLFSKDAADAALQAQLEVALPGVAIALGFRADF